MRRDLTSRRGDVGMLASVALAKLAPHLVLSGRYGYWRRGPPFRVTTADHRVPWARGADPGVLAEGQVLDLRPARLRARAAGPGRELGGCVALSHDHFEG